MKFCSKCGAQYGDDATFCTQCGSSLNANSAPVNPNPAPMGYAPMPNYGYAPAPKKPFNPEILNVFKLVYNISLVMFACFAFFYLRFLLESFTWSILASLMSSTALAFGIVGFVFGMKEADKAKKMDALSRFIIGIIVFIASVVMIAYAYAY